MSSANLQQAQEYFRLSSQINLEKELFESRPDGDGEEAVPSSIQSHDDDSNSTSLSPIKSLPPSPPDVALPHRSKELDVKFGRPGLAGSNNVSATPVNPAVSLSSEKEERLRTQNASLVQQLEVQYQVNKEIKRLLVASVGDDLHHNIETMARDKSQLTVVIDELHKKLTQGQDQLEKAMIQCDVWRSKFLAARMMVDELNNYKSILGQRFKDSKTALTEILDEREEIRKQQQHTYRLLSHLNYLLSNVSSTTSNEKQPHNNISLARANRQLVTSAHSQLLGESATLAKLPQPMKPDAENSMTAAEQFAEEIVLDHSYTPADSNTSIYIDDYSGVVQLKFQPIPRFHPTTRYDRLTLTCCKNCTGDLQVL